MSHLFISEVWIEAIGWTLFHTLWQCSLVAIILWIALKLMQRVAAHWQYIASLAGLIACTIWVGISLWQQYDALVLPLPSSIENQIDPSLLQKFTLTQVTTVSNDFDGFWQYLRTQATPYLPWFFYSWLLGIAFLGVRLVGGLSYVNYLLRAAVAPIQHEWIELIDHLSEKMGINHQVLLKVSHQIGEPIAIGYIKPVILFPLGLLSGLNPDQIEAILIHELAHIRRGDYWVNLFQNLVETILFFHPAVWWISSQVRKTREDCCDDWVLEMGSDPSIYAAALLDIHSFNQLPKTHLAMSATGKTGHLTQRIHRLFAKSVTKTNAFQRSAWAMILLCVGVFSVAFKVNVPLNIAEEQDLPASLSYVEAPLDVMSEKVDEKNVSGFISDLVEDKTSHNTIEEKDSFPILPIEEKEKVAIPSVVLSHLIARMDTPIKKIIIEGKEKKNPVIRLNGAVGAEPLYILNGKKLDKGITLDEIEIDPNDIESIDVLKGESAKAAYGEDGENGVVRIHTKEGVELKIKEKNEAEVKIELGKNPLYIIDGVKLDRSTTRDELELNPDDIESVDVLKGESARALYGEEGENGVVIIKTKEGLELKVKKEAEAKVNVENPLYVVDGVKLDRGTTSDELELDPSEIESIDVLKGESARKAYGEEGENGVIQIWTKKGTKNKLKDKRTEKIEKVESIETPPAPPSPYDMFNTTKNMLHFIDGMPIEALGITPQNIKQKVQEMEIDYIRVIDGKSLKSQGIEGVAGAIYIYTKGGQYAEKKDATSSLVPIDLNVYPNPSDDFVNIEITTRKDAEARVFVLNSNGQLVAQLMDGQLQANERKKLNWSAKNQSAGTYYVYLIKDGKVMSKAVQIQK